MTERLRRKKDQRHTEKSLDVKVIGLKKLDRILLRSSVGMKNKVLKDVRIDDIYGRNSLRPFHLHRKVSRS